MNRNRIYFSALILVLIVIIGWSSTGMLQVGRSEKSYDVSVIVSDSNSDRWIALRQGLEQAAGDHNVNLNYVSTGKLTSGEEELALIQREVENGADGILVQMVSGDGVSESLEEISSRTAVMLLETDVSPEDVYAFTEPDNIGIGEAVASAVKVDFGEHLQGKKIGILCGNLEQISMQQRIDGLTESLSASGVGMLWTIDTQNAAMEQEDVSKLEQADLIIALDNEATEWIVDWSQSSENYRKNCRLYGVGCSEKAVYYLDKGTIQTLIVPNEFNMGYQSVEAITKQMQYRLSKAENQTIEYQVVNQSNLYDADNQKILFPIVQ